jgi:EmrB/QacA subfamily drug resistance transporter
LLRNQRINDQRLNGSTTSTPDVVGAASPEELIGRNTRFFIVVASLLALFLGALDALVMSTAMPTIVSELGGVHLYSWAFSAYMLARAVALPLFGKLTDLFQNKTLFVISIVTFVAGSVFAGFSQSMTQLIVFRVIQGIGAGGNFALVYVVLADISSPEKRGKALSLASFVWGFASVLGPTIGGFIVTYLSWRWIFFINIPLGGISLVGLSCYLIEVREKNKEIAIDYWGMTTLTVTVLALLTACLLVGQRYKWTSPEVLVLLAVTLTSGLALYKIEKKAKEPILPIGCFKIRGFSIGNGASFFSSFAIFSLFAYSPLFIQGVLDKTPLQLGGAMLSLSLGWSLGALFCGQTVHLLHKKPEAVMGGVMMAAGCSLTLWFSPSTSLLECALVFFVIGSGMGFVSIPTLLIVQESLESSDLGVATSSHQFSRTLGGTLGIGIAGSFVSAKFSNRLEAMRESEIFGKLPDSLQAHLQNDLEKLLGPEALSAFSSEIQIYIQDTLTQGVKQVFWAALAVSVIALVFCLMLPKQRRLG